MGKSSMCLQMLQLLNTGRVYKCSELAEILETNSRNIIEYKKELEEAGYYITSIPGKYGGYKLEKTCLIPSLRLLGNEEKALIEAYTYVLKKKDFIFKKEFQLGMSKIISNNVFKDVNSELLLIDKYELTMTEENLKNLYSYIEISINKKCVLEIEYRLPKGNVIYQIHPYKLFILEDEWALLAWNPSVGDVDCYLLSKIKQYSMLNQKFTVYKYFDPNKFFDKCGSKLNDEYYLIEFIATNETKLLFEDRIIGRKQQITAVGKNKVKVSLELQNKNEIVSLFLSFGTNVDIISPIWLKKEIVSISNKLLSKYKNE